MRCAAPSPRGSVEAKQTVPHFDLTCEVALDRIEAVRAEANASAGRDGDGAPAYRLSLNDFLLKALAGALERVPAANAVWAEDRILRFRSADIAVAVALDGGLDHAGDPRRRDRRRSPPFRRR